MPDTYEYRKLESLNKLVAAEKRTEEAGKPARRNIYAVVAESWVEEVRVEGESEPRRSIIFRLMDESSVAAAMTTDGTLTAHFSGAKLPPLFKSGTILRAHRILAKSRTALPSRAELVGRLGEAGCHIVAWSIPDPPNLPSQLSSIYESSKNITFTPSDQERLEELTQWWRDEMDAGKRALALSPTADQKLAKVSVPDPGPLGRGRMVSCDVLSQLVPGSYYNLVLEVIGVLELSTGVVIVRAWDGSTPAIETARVDFKTEQTDPSEPPKLDEEKDALLFSDNWRKCYAVDIFIYDEFTREALAYEPGDVVLFWNCHAYFRKAPATALLPLDQGVQRKWVQTCLTFHGRRPNQLQHRSLQLLYQPAQPDQPLRDTHGSLALFRRSLAARLRALRSHVAREQRQNPIPLPSSSAAARNDDEDENEEESWQENFEEDVEAYERQLAAVKAAEKEKAAQAERERRRRGKNKREQPDSSLPLPLAGDESSVVSQSQDLPKTPKCSTTGDGKQQGSRTSERTKSPSKTQGIRTRSQSAKSSEASNSSYHTAMESQPSKPSTRGSGRKQTKEVEEASLSSHSPLHDSETELNLAPEVDESQSQDVWASQPVEKRVTRSKQAEKAVATGSSLQDHDDDGITISPIKTPKRHQSIGSPGGGVGRSGSESKRKRDERQPRRSPRTRASDSDSPILSSKKRKGNAKLDSSSSHDDDFHPLATSTLAAGESQPGEGITRDRRQLNAELKSQHQLSPISELSQEAPIEISSRSDLNDGKLSTLKAAKVNNLTFHFSDNNCSHDAWKWARKWAQRSRRGRASHRRRRGMGGE